MDIYRKSLCWLPFFTVFYIISMVLLFNGNTALGLTFLLLLIFGSIIIFAVISSVTKKKVKIVQAEGESVARQHSALLAYVGSNEFIVLCDREMKLYYKNFKNGNNELRQIDYNKLCMLKCGIWTSKLILTDGESIDIVFRGLRQITMLIQKINAIIQLSRMQHCDYRVTRSENAETDSTAPISQNVETDKTNSSQRAKVSFCGYEGNIYCIAPESAFVFPATYEFWKEGEYVCMKFNNILDVHPQGKRDERSVNRNPNYDTYKFAIKNIVSIEQEGDVHYTSNVHGGDTSVTGALAGGVLFGGVGAILGGKKKISTTTRQIDDRITKLKLVDDSNQYCALKFAYNDYYVLDRLINNGNAQ